MRTISFKQLLEGVFAHAGLALADAGDDDRRAVIAALADRYKFAAEYYRWPELLETEQRWFRPLWTGQTGVGPFVPQFYYPWGTEVYYQGAYWQTAGLQLGPGVPDTAVPGESASWVQFTPADRRIEFAQYRQTEIAVVVGAWLADPRVDEDATPCSWVIRGDGVWIPPGIELADGVWLEFMSPLAEFTAAIYDATAAYAAGRRVYFEDPGEVYVAREATTAGQTPLTHAAKWELVPFPAFLELAVKAGAYADWLTGDERPNAARLWDAKFIELLDEQVWQLTKLQGQTGRPRFAPKR